MVKVELRAVGAQLVIPVEHQHVLDDQAVGLAGVDILAHVARPGGGPVHNLQVLIGAVHQLAPAGLVQTEDQIAVLVLVGGLDGGGVAVRSVSQCAEIQYAVVHFGIPPRGFAALFQEYFSTGGSK